MVKQAPPFAPTAGRIAVYIKSDAKMYFMDEAGVETVVGGARKFSLVTGDGAISIFDVIHGFNTKDIDISVYGPTSGFQVTEVGIIDNNTIRVTFDSAPPINSVRVVVIA